jgi:release factor glutamine methyltransferase
MEASQKQWTIKNLLDWLVPYFDQHQLDSPRLMAEILLSHVLNMQRIELYTRFDEVVKPVLLKELRVLVKRASSHEPIQYLTGRAWFYSLPLTVNSSVLIPRPETEMLVEKAVDYLRGCDKVCQVLDLCTGSACVPIAAAKNTKDTFFTATDISEDALAVADVNVNAHDLSDRIRLLKGDVFGAVVEGLDEVVKFDLITANPPYVTTCEYENLDENVKNHEPAHALAGGEDGLDVYRKIASDIGEFLNPDSAVILETSPVTGESVVELLNSTGFFAEIKLEKDRSGEDRLIVARSKSSRS